MDILILCNFAANGGYFEAACYLEEDPNLTTEDVIEAVDNEWPFKIAEVNYIVEEERKIYSIECGDSHNNDVIHQKMVISNKWQVSPK